IAGAGVVPLTRVPWNTAENIKRVLDTGAWGIVVPMVNSRAEAEAAVAAARYAPQGNRSIGGLSHATNFDADPATYYRRANDEILVTVMIEHVNAVAAVDEIASAPGVDVIFIGPNDLHNSMGKPPAFESNEPEFLAAVEAVLAAAKKHGITPGIHVADLAQAKRRLEQGFRFIAIASETGFMLAKAKEILTGLGLGLDKAVAKY
ncbi:MAG TPA: aldolase/citrate lyase family protein, partial [Verrucomicrobiae bacterium]|nr:aldolase/citrate lyase family protein [Verrucomicrobiae bacterium]